MPDTWSLEGEWFKNCNCDPGCPCDFNQAPTTGQCEGIIGMRITNGHFGHVRLDGLKFAGVAYWPGRLDEGDGHILPIVDESADEEQRRAILTIMSGQAGGTIFEIFSAVCPHVREPVFVPIDFEFDIEQRRGRLKAGDYLDTEVESLKAIGSDDPYRVLVEIPGGFEYTGPGNKAETALSTRLKTGGGDVLDYEHENTHSSMAEVRHSGVVPEAV